MSSRELLLGTALALACCYLSQVSLTSSHRSELIQSVVISHVPV